MDIILPNEFHITKKCLSDILEGKTLARALPAEVANPSLREILKFWSHNDNKKFRQDTFRNKTNMKSFSVKLDAKKSALYSFATFEILLLAMHILLYAQKALISHRLLLYKLKTLKNLLYFMNKKQ